MCGKEGIRLFELHSQHVETRKTLLHAVTQLLVQQKGQCLLCAQLTRTAWADFGAGMVQQI